MSPMKKIPDKAILCGPQWTLNERKQCLGHEVGCTFVGALFLESSLKLSPTGYGGSWKPPEYYSPAKDKAQNSGKRESPNEHDRQMAMFYWGAAIWPISFTSPLLLFFYIYHRVSLLYHNTHKEGIFLIVARQREKGEREMKLEEVFGDGRAGKEMMVSLFQGHFPLPTPPIPRISFGSSLSLLQLSSQFIIQQIVSSSFYLYHKDQWESIRSEGDWKGWMVWKMFYFLVRTSHPIFSY